MHLNSITSWKIGRYPDVTWMTALFCLIASREEIGLSTVIALPHWIFRVWQTLSLFSMRLVHPVQVCTIALITLICIIC